MMTREPVPSPHTLTYSHIMPGIWFSIAATSTAARAQRWFRDLFCATEVQAAERENRNVYQMMDTLAASAQPGADGLFFHPYLQGERSPYWDPKLRASFVGATLRHTQADFMRAVLEGVVYSLLDCFRTIETQGLDINTIRLIGGGAKSPLWRQIVADVFGRKILIPKNADASFGSALLAGVGIGAFSDEWEAVQRCLREAEPVLPIHANQERYAKLFPMYQKIHDVLKDVYRQVADLSELPVALLKR